MVATQTNRSTDEHNFVGGLFVQIIFFWLLHDYVHGFEMRIRQNPSRALVELAHVWHRHMVALDAASALILVRSVIRVVEYL